jgi:hypothetical protein
MRTRILLVWQVEGGLKKTVNKTVDRGRNPGRIQLSTGGGGEPGMATEGMQCGVLTSWHDMMNLLADWLDASQIMGKGYSSLH